MLNKPNSSDWKPLLSNWIKMPRSWGVTCSRWTYDLHRFLSRKMLPLAVSTPSHLKISCHNNNNKNFSSLRWVTIRIFWCKDSQRILSNYSLPRLSSKARTQIKWSIFQWNSAINSISSFPSVIQTDKLTSKAVIKSRKRSLQAINKSSINRSKGRRTPLQKRPPKPVKALQIIRILHKVEPVKKFLEAKLEEAWFHLQANLEARRTRIAALCCSTNQAWLDIIVSEVTITKAKILTSSSVNRVSHQILRAQSIRIRLNCSEKVPKQTRITVLQQP